MISIIIPIYNGEKYIKDCIRSIQERILPYYEIEIIIINDGSVDNSAAICESLAKKYDYIKVIHQDNSGVSIARQRGIESARFENIMFIDIDDIIGSDFNVKLDNKTDFYIFSEYFDEDFVLDFQDSYYELIEGLLGVNKSNKYTKAHIHTVWSKIYKATIIRENNIKFEGNVFHGEDILFNLEYLKNCKKIKCIKKSYYVLRQNENSATHKFQENSIINDYNYYKKLETYNFNKDNKLKYLYYKSVLNGIWITLNQYFFNDKNIKKLSDKKRDLENMLSKEPYNTAINKYTFLSKGEKKIFFELMKYKQFTLLYFLYKVCYKLFRKRKLHNYKI